ncbi:MAG: nitroreductase family protein [Betaproteobacteria bacterium]
MHDTLVLLKQRKSVRVFEDRPVAPETKAQILGAAFEAPTAGALMLYSILDITDQRLKDRLAELCDHQPFIARAPLVLVFLADVQRWYDAYRYAGCEVRPPGPGDLLLACADALIAAQNTVVAAEALGLGSCYIGDVLENCAVVRDLLGLPDYVLPAAMVVYGYPAAAQRARKKPARFAPEYLVFTDRYRRLTPEEHQEMQRRRSAEEGRAVEDPWELVRAVCQRKYMADFALELNRSVREYLAAFSAQKL